MQGRIGAFCQTGRPEEGFPCPAHRIRGRKGAAAVAERFSLAGGRGSLTLTGLGDRVRAEVRLADDGRGLYKAYLLGRGGRFLLGTLVPEGGALVLDRTLGLAGLVQMGVWPPLGGTAELAFAFGPGAGQPEGAQGRPQRAAPVPPGWRREPRPERLFGEALLQQSAQGLRGALVRREGDRIRLALPWRPDGVFPLTPLFCFAVPERLDGALYVSFLLNGRGCPISA